MRFSGAPSTIEKEKPRAAKLVGSGLIQYLHKLRTFFLLSDPNRRTFVRCNSRVLRKGVFAKITSIVKIGDFRRHAGLIDLH